jgi:hypothetical protein
VTRLKYPHLAATRIYRSAPVLRLFRPRSGAARRTFHRYALLQRSKARGLPSVASPFAGTSVHRTLVFIRLTPVPAHGRDIVSSPPTGLFPDRGWDSASRFAPTRVTPTATDTGEQMESAHDT